METASCSPKAASAASTRSRSKAMRRRSMSCARGSIQRAASISRPAPSTRSKARSSICSTPSSVDAAPTRSSCACCVCPEQISPHCAVMVSVPQYGPIPEQQGRPMARVKWIGTVPAVLAASAVAMLESLAAGAQQPPNIGIAPVELTQNAYTFDTAEQHKVRVVVVAKGLKHPFAVALLPDGDALVSERGAALRLVHDATGADGKPAVLDPTPISGLPTVEPKFRGGGLQDVVL